MQNNTQKNAKQYAEQCKKLLYKELSYKLQGLFYEVYKLYRNSQKEIVYHNTLLEMCKESALSVKKNEQISILYKGKRMGTYTPDLIIENKIIVELKCKPVLLKSDISQFWHYLKATDYKVGYLVNFGKPNGVDIIRRVYDIARIGVVSRQVSRSLV